MHTHLARHLPVLLIAAASLGGLTPSAYGQASMQGGTLEVASSWKGTPIHGYSDVHNSDSKTHGPTTSEIAYSSLPLSIAHSYAYDYNANGYRLESDLGMNWGSEGNSGTWEFTYRASQQEQFRLSKSVSWTSVMSTVGPFPYTYFWLDDLSHGGPSIDLLAVHSGTLPSGDYRWRCLAEGAWTTSDQSFLYGSHMKIEFSTVPGPGVAGIAAVGGMLVSGRRRR